MTVNTFHRRNWNLAQFGITIEQYDKMLAAQDGVCAICAGECGSGRRLAVDHDHGTGRVRALLCVRCNRQLGLFEAFRDRATAYLAEYGNGNPLLNGEGAHAPRRTPYNVRRNGNARLSQQEADEVRRRYAAGGVTQRALAAEYGVSQNTIGCIVRIERWASRENRVQALLRTARKLSTADVAAVRERHGNGESIKAIARSLRVSHSTISYIVNGKTWRNN